MRLSVIKDKSFAFSIWVIRLYKYLIEEKREFALSKQLLRSGTAVGALVREAQNAESSNDFIHKPAIAQKECDETIYWLELLKETEFVNEPEFESLQFNANELLKMIRSSILTMKQKAHNS